MKKTTTCTTPLEAENAIRPIANSINAGETIIFCGAGISRDSGFPIVNELVTNILLKLCPNSKGIVDEAALKGVEDMKQIIAEKTEVSPEAIDKIINALPFEAFMECLRENSKVDDIFDIFDADVYDPNAKPNTNHILLAKLIAAGKLKTIVTTNFDQLIEKALEQQGKQAGRDYDVIYLENEFEHIDWTQVRCRLIKIHGSIHDKSAMAITLRQVAAQELSIARAGIIRHIFSEGKHKQVLILGYSCSDVFDLSPQIESLTGTLKQVYLVQHSNSFETENIKKQEQKNPFKSIGNGIRLFLNTNHLVKSIWEAILAEPYPETDNAHTSNPPNWKAKVNTWYEDSVRNHSEVIKDAILGQLFNLLSEWQAAINRYEHVLAHTKIHANILFEKLALNNMSGPYRKLGQCHEAIKLLKQYLKICQDTKDVEGEGKALENMSLAYCDLSDFQKALELSEQALEIARRMKDERRECHTLNTVANNYRNLRNYPNTIKFSKKALDIAQRTGDVRAEASALGNMGMAHRNLGEHKKARECFEEHRKKARYLGDEQGEGADLVNIGSIHVDHGNYAQALQFYEQALVMYRRINYAMGVCNALVNIGNTYNHLFNHPKAIELSEQALEIAPRIEDANDEAAALKNIGIAHLAMGEKGKAAEPFMKSRAIYTRIKLPLMVSEIDSRMKEAGL